MNIGIKARRMVRRSKKNDGSPQMTATLKRKVINSSTQRATDDAVWKTDSAINAFTLIRDCATELAAATPRYRRARYLLTARQLEIFFLDGVVADPDCLEQQKSLSDASRELRTRICYLATNISETAGGVLQDLTQALCSKGAPTSEQFGEIADVFAAWHDCERLLNFGELTQSSDQHFAIPSDAKLDAINANLAVLLASLRDRLGRLGFNIPGE